MQRNYDQELNIAHIQLKRAWINMWSGILSLTAVLSLVTWWIMGGTISITFG